MSLISTPGNVAESSADRSIEKALTGGSTDIFGRVFMWILLLSLLTTVAILGVLVVDVVSTAWPTLSGGLGEFLTTSVRSKPGESGIVQGLRGTFFIGLFTIVIAFPMGISAAIYLEEYAADGKLKRFIDLNIRNLAGVPSVVYGILGLTLFVKALRTITGPESNGQSVVSAGLTLAILVLPIVIITASEAIRAVPDHLREAGYGVGATRSEVIRHHVLPYAAPGILTGTVLALARALGEAAPLILVGATTGYYTRGSSFGLDTLQDRFFALPITITTWAKQPGEGWGEKAAAAIVVLLFVVLVANTGAILLRNRFERKRAGV
jgi:phosphate transport system permease protein